LLVVVQAEAVSVQLYVENNDRVVTLHTDMVECDSVLARMEEMLHGFQADLGKISSEIKHLQEDSLAMSLKLRNRKAAEEKLHVFVERANVPPAVIHDILSPHVNDAFVEAVQILRKRLYYFELEGPPTDDSSLQLLPGDTRCGISLYPELDKLRIKAVTKIRDYFSTQFANLRKPKTNVHMLQQSALLKYALLFQFLQKECQPVADDLRALYVETMGRTLLNLFKSYYTQLSKLEQVIATKTDLIAVEEQSLKSIFTQKLDMTKRSDTFSLSEREHVLEQVRSQCDGVRCYDSYCFVMCDGQIEREPILVHVAVAENMRLPYECILRSVLKHLVDSASNEFLFVIEFFRTNPKDTFNKSVYIPTTADRIV
jgi:vacuolar protein sorting-associated protein 52